jgi:hypothetical protein
VNARQQAWTGMNWLRQEKRLAIYLRDGLACVWCAAAIEDGARLTLDHLRPHVHGGSNAATNLVTACKRCNDSRGARSVAKFAATVAAYLNHGVRAAAILAHVRRQPKLQIDVTEAKRLIARRGSVARVLAARSTHNVK